MTTRSLVNATILVLLVAAAGCGDQEQEPIPPPAGVAAGESHVESYAEMVRDVDAAVAVLQPTAGHDVRGEVHFRQLPHAVHVVAHVTGLEPNARHGFHIHEYGDLTAPNGAAAGAHYNPDGCDHGLPPMTPRHAGDLGNLETDADGAADFELTVDNFSIAGPHNPVLGRAVIVHADPDDGSQPAGNAGARIAQGVIGIAEPVSRAE